MESPRIISMEFSTAGRDDCYYRILAGTSVKYVTIQAGALDADLLMDMPLNFENILPSLPYTEHHWNQAYISRNATSGELESVLSQTDLPRVQTIWHSKMINFMDLERTEQLGLLAQECVWKQNLADGSGKRIMIAKMARFPWEIRYIEKETQIYRLLEHSHIAPRFLGHVHEAGRVIGFLLEKVEGRPATWRDLKACEGALRHLHDLGVLHGDCNPYNFIVGPNEMVALVDFENAKVDADKNMMEREIESLDEQFREDAGRGGDFMEEGSD
ncbi:hypothetical protein S7711_04152 [Stachybotrys chartarum IBT 7711]|uniref:Aminoglycoside phosphotransferase domain-containing protein n=1 Tax=Stachybotrys chartarum (strain CBS 109288 / IBT 7711) TaxID=1280523 RepID=A0A084B6K7_STACB|nr:hypothetical protein S7711_04152 [Stachybotrys chartarum IBT 7711]KFA71231.1 hypothetical protein S40288_03854 [Stachybotrys chartarum IBT 40288]